MKPIKFLLLLFVTSASALLAGVDLSFVEMLESYGVIYRDEHGQPTDLFQIMKDNSINIIRLRLFTATEEQARIDPYSHGNTLNRTLRLARRTKTHGLQFMLDFHYSDTWADPSHQAKPSAWANLTFEQLTNALYNYTRDTLRVFVEQDTIPQYIQIGNEVTYGMLWPDGRVGLNNSWTQFMTLLNAASQGVRSVLKNQTKIVVHITAPDKPEVVKNFFDHVVGNIDFDIIGISYYPFWNGNFTRVRHCFEQVSHNYDKQLFIAETNYRWKEDKYSNVSLKNITGYDETPEGQMQYAVDLEKILVNLTNEKREAGVFWWATEFVATKDHPRFAGHELQSFFDFNGTALPIVQAFGQFGRPKA
jgi:arabinogalactan endo-1,4-beta-galactosidase